ncbi:PepSY-associated TM helix domain-containing protein [Saccharophagus degradans]|uniref:PepSY-associated TM helix domain-containing protein n=1 Tax=Saccharophagus degradans TaxID=86304 RepID=A0AAW7X7H8_9GAMM|nr:PepSY-associated TM helix domain-containing protein [Saccharophagus degradans]MDO6422458.1 PepSY-associated TM helix domain-containing protein [Saccharophagus degradans]MDO6606939.1 PepSY-associated TM helix domain-containing protein [Saccharophagus degradans]
MAAIWRKLHKILGLTLGALLLIMCFSGGVLVFKNNLISLNLNADTVAPSYNMDNISQGLRDIISKHDLDDIYYIKSPTQGRRYWLLVTKDEHMHMYDGSTGAPIADKFYTLAAMHWLTHFHAELLLPNSGTTILTILGVLTLVLMLAGFFSWWPGRKGFKLQHLWATPSRRGPALRQHRALAIICIPLLLLSVVTGGGMTVQSAIRFLFQPAPPAQLASVEPPIAHHLHTFDISRLDSMLQKAQQALPNSEITLIGLPSSERNQMRMRFRATDEWHVNGKTNVTIDTETGEMKIKGIKDASAGRKILNTFYPLHSSYGLPSLYKAFIALTGILSVWLAIIGYIAWFKKRKQTA